LQLAHTLDGPKISQNSQPKQIATPHAKPGKAVFSCLFARIKAIPLCKRAHTLGEDLINIIKHFQAKKNQIGNKNKPAHNRMLSPMRTIWPESRYLDFGA